ncbi:MAG: TetR/AcrR family transcriptional regulator [Pseudomonadota bacterium]|nr:TetR/AcrR family transcriptional regulator [Pseudomonadota bacterium]
MKSRPYVQNRRAEAAANTAARIIEAVTHLFLESGDTPTLEAVAQRAEVAVQTILRRFGSKEGLLAAAFDDHRQRVVDQRNHAPVGDIVGAVANLGEHYAEAADVALRLLANEGKSSAATEATREGRAVHRAWVERVFAPFVAALDEPERERRLVQAVVVTDVYVWKLLHRDLGLSRAETESTMVELLRRILIST